VKQKGHHYITESYQRGFTDENGHVWVLTPEGKIFNSNPENTFKEDHFYTIKLPQGGGSLAAEKTLAELEGAYIAAISKIEKGEELTDDDRIHIAMFVAAMFTRTKIHREHLKGFLENVIDKGERMKEAMRGKKMPRALESSGGPSMSLTELKEGMKDLDTQQTLMMMTNTLEMAPVILEMNWWILKASEGETFVTSDNPLAMCSPEREKKYGHRAIGAAAGLAHADVEVTFPLSKKYALYASWKSEGNITTEVPATTVQQLNFRTMRSAKNVVASKRQIVEEILEKSKKNKPA